jgi:hypothetical protein
MSLGCEFMLDQQVEWEVWRVCDISNCVFFLVFWELYNNFSKLIGILMASTNFLVKE